MHLLQPSEADYPATLHELVRPPPELYADGDIRLLAARPCVAIVGSREASERGRSLAWLLGRDLAVAGATVVSGGALGIDAAAHHGALDGASGRCVVVLPSAIDDPRPASNRGLFAAIVRAGGLLVSEYASTPPGRYAYCARNRIIAALAQVVVVVEARQQSGTQHTVREARRLGRVVAAIPWSIGDSGGAGCLDILRSGARAVLCAEDVLTHVGLAAHVVAGTVRRRRPRGSSGRVLVGSHVVGTPASQPGAAREDTPREMSPADPKPRGTRAGETSPGEMSLGDPKPLDTIPAAMSPADPEPCDSQPGEMSPRRFLPRDGSAAVEDLLALLPPLTLTPAHAHTRPDVAPEWAARRLGAPLAQVLAWFSELELQGLVRPVGGGRYVRRF